ncbi:MAG: metallophosphoesterase [bacterium]
MKLGILSDTHDHLPRITAAAAEFRKRGITRLIHCGDIVAPFALFPLKEAKFEECVGVYGNNDGEWRMLREVFKNIGMIHKPPYFEEIAGRRFAILHEPQPDDVMASMPVDVVLFGHTHEIVIRPGKQGGGPLVLNPGEGCGYLNNRATVAALDTETLEVELIELP